VRARITPSTVDAVQFRGPRGTIFTFDRDLESVSVFAKGSALGVLGGRRGWHQMVPLDDLVAVAEHAKARWQRGKDEHDQSCG
jgi:hypothetical protein